MLPTQLTRFIGREAELAQLRPLMARSRMLTLVGSSGCGKTRLAIRAAEEVVDAYGDGVWWVDLAPLSGPELLPRAVLTALGIKEGRGCDPIERLTGHLVAQQVLLVVDNCEHVLGAAAELLEAVLRDCPGVIAWATSREPLGVPGETTWRVPPLSLPPLHAEGLDADEIVAFDAIGLFMARSVDARPGFRLDPGQADVIVEICSRLDGIPLAIELAAARIRTLDPKDILEALADRFRLLTGGARTSMARQQTLQASVEWSHDLLSPAERVLFRRLGVFVSGFSVDAAREVGAGDPLDAVEILGLLTQLVEKSLVVFDEGVGRYHLLQTMRDFAVGKLVAAGEVEAVRGAHARFYLSLGESASIQLEAALRAEMLAALEADHDNLRAALEWALAEGDGEGALRLVVALMFFWLVHGHYAEAQASFRRALDVAPPDPSPLRVKALWGLGHFRLYSLDLEGPSVVETDEAVAMARTLGDPGLLARALADQGALQSIIVPDRAQITLEEAVDAARRSGDEWALVDALWWLAFFWICSRDRTDLAQPLLEELRVMADRSQDPYWLGWHRFLTGLAALHQGRLEAARTDLEDALERAYELADPMLEVYAVGWLLDTLIAQGDFGPASSLVSVSVRRLNRSMNVLRTEWVEVKQAAAALAGGNIDAAAPQLEQLGSRLQDYGVPFVTTMSAVMLGRLRLERGDLAAAALEGERAAVAAAAVGFPWCLAEADNFRGRVARAAGDPAAAEDLHHRALAVAVQHRFSGVAAETLEALASLAAAGGSAAEAARLFGAAQALRVATGQRRWPLDQPAWEADVASLAAALGEEGLMQAWAEGGALSLDEAAAYASRARGERKRPSSGWSALTPTELKVVALAAKGLTNAEIARRLFMSAGTAKIHLSHVYAKLGLANRAELAARATERALKGGSASE